jgi:hypothetical protein
MTTPDLPPGSLAANVNINVGSAKRRHRGAMQFVNVDELIQVSLYHAYDCSRLLRFNFISIVFPFYPRSDYHALHQKMIARYAN